MLGTLLEIAIALTVVPAAKPVTVHGDEHAVPDETVGSEPSVVYLMVAQVAQVMVYFGGAELSGTILGASGVN